MADITVQKVERSKSSKRELYARVCFYYPQYTLTDVQQMPNRDVSLLLRVANQIEATKMLNLTQIASAPHTKKGAGVKKLINHYKKIAKGNQ